MSGDPSPNGAQTNPPAAPDGSPRSLSVPRGRLGAVPPIVLDAAVTTRCRRRVHLEHDPAAGVPGPDGPLTPSEPDPGVAMRRADAAAHRAAVAARWEAALGAGVAVVPVGSGREERVRRTREVLEAPDLPGGPTHVLSAELAPGGGRRGGAELLVRAAGGWYPVIVVRHRVSDPGEGALTSSLERPHPDAASPDPTRRMRGVTRDVLRLAHLHRMLEAQGAAARPGRHGAVWGGVVGLDADAVVWVDLAAAAGGPSALDSYDRRLADRLAVAAAARAGDEPLAYPSRITDCRSCPWWPTCEAELRATDDVSLVVRGDDAVRLRGRGVTTVRALAALDPARGLPALLAPGAGDAPMGEDAPGVDLRQAVALARAWRADVPLVRRVRRPDVPRADVEVDVDMESLGEDGAYLWGTLLSGVDVGLPPGYRGFATWVPLPTPDEGRSFGAFWTWLTDVRARAAARGLTLRAYCYNEQAENRWLRASTTRFAGAPGVPPPAEVEAFIGSGEWVDLFPAVSDSFLCPRGKGLKRVAPSAGFAWRDPEAGGENSMRWYRRAVGLDGEEPDATQRDRLLVYNEDDVRATHALRTWMTSDAVLDVPHVDELPADPPGTAPAGPALSAAASAAPRRTG